MDIVILIAFVVGFITHKIYDYFSPFVIILGNDIYRNKVEPDTKLENNLTQYMKKRFNEDHIARIDENKLKMKELKIRPDGWIYTMEILTNSKNKRLSTKSFRSLNRYINNLKKKKQNKLNDKKNDNE